MPDRFSPSDAESMQWPILLAEGENGGIPGVAMNRPVCVVGARCLVHLPLSANTVSKSQALIVQDAGGVYLRDLASKNGTYVNGRPVREVWLETSDTVQFAPFAFRCHSGFDRAHETTPAPAAELWLEPDGLASRQVVSVKQQTFLIGSRHDCDLLLNGAEIALAHAVIFARDGRRYLRDLSTMTGTSVNGNRIREIELMPGDEIRIGASRIEYHPIEPRTVAAEMSSDGTVVNFAAESESAEAEEMSAAASDRVRFEISDEVQPAVAVKPPAKRPEDQIVLPWDDEPMELELVDSRGGE